MKLKCVEIENYRAIEYLRLPLDPELTVLHGDNTCGKTSVLSAIAVGLGAIPKFLPGGSGIDYLETDLRAAESFVQVDVTTTDEFAWKRERFVGGGLERAATRTHGLEALKDKLSEIVLADREASPPIALPIVAFYDTNRAALHVPEHGATTGRRYAAKAAQTEMLARVGQRQLPLERSVGRPSGDQGHARRHVGAACRHGTTAFLGVGRNGRGTHGGA